MGKDDVERDLERETITDADPVAEDVARWVAVELAARGCTGLDDCDAVGGTLDVAVRLCVRLGVCVVDGD